MTPQRFAQRVRNDLRARRWLRWHCSLIGLLTLLAGWACSHALMRMGTDALWLRWGASFAVAYGVLMLLLYLWARWLLSRDEGDWLDGDPGLPGGGLCSPDLPGAITDGAGEAVGGALEIAGAADEGAIVLIPIALLVGIALAIGTVLGFAVFGLFGVEVLLAVAVEIALASVGGALAYKAGAEGWLSAAWRRTAWPAVATLACVVVLGAAIDHWLPQARSLPHALRLLRL
jgi:hypothetical protein